MATSRQPQPGVVWADHLLDEVDVTPAAASLLGVGPGEILAIDFILAMKLLVSLALNHEDLPSTFDSLFDDVSEDLDVTLRFADAPSHLRIRAYVSPQSGFVGRLWTFDDVSAADAAENALEAANEMLRANADSMLDSQVLIEAVRDPAGRVVDFVYRAVNRAACSLMRVRESELIGSRFLNTRGVDTAELMQRWVQCLQDGQPVGLDDFVFSGGDFGAARRFDIRATRAGVGRLSVTWSEVTERFLAQQATEAAHGLLRASTDSMLDPQVLFEAVRAADGRVVDLGYRSVNRAACLFLGREEHELVTVSQLESMANLEGSGLWERLLDCLETGSPLVLDDFPFYSELFDDERRVDFRATKAGPDLISLTWRDVTERFEATQRVAASERNYRLLAENSPDIVCHIRDDRIVWVSPSVEDVLGAPPEFWIGRESREVIPPADAEKYAALVSQVLAGEGVQTRARVTAVDGVAHWVHVRGRPFADADGHQDGFTASLRVIDDEVAAQQAAEAAHALLRASSDSMLDPQLLLEAVRDPGGRAVDFVIRGANHAACSYLGRDEGELLGSSPQSPTPVSSSSWLKERFVQCLQDGKPVILDDFTDLNSVVDDASRFDIRASKAGPDLISLTWSDVTGRYRAVQRLAASERQYRLLAENAADVVAHIRDGRFIWISPSCEEALGAPPEYWIGREVVSVIPPEDEPILAADTSNVMAGGIVKGRVRVISTDGVTHWADMNARPLHDDDGRQDGFTASIRLIDDEVAAEQEAQVARSERARADERYRRSIDNAAIGVSVITTDGRFLEVNDALCQFYGYEAATLLKKTWQELTAPDYLLADAEKASAVLEGRLDSYRMVKQYIHADGHPIWGDLSVSCVRDENGHVESFVTQVADITARVEATERNRVLAQQLEQQREQLAAELDSAAAYMASIMPTGLTGKVEVSSRYLPSQALGGDCFNYFWVDDDHLVVKLIDVSGHGIEPALLSVSVHNLLRSGTLSTETLLEPRAALTELNRLFQMDRHSDHYFTIWYGIYQASSRTLRYASAGTPPALAFNPAAGGTVSVTELSTATAPIGMFEDTVFTSGSYLVPPGCRILIHSDGASEVDLVDGTQLSLAGFKTLATRLAGSPGWSLDALIDELRALTPTGFLADDCSLIELTFD